ncbi:MAG: hypothetical protein QW471_02400 [Candidatus Woesearchaeota archaeon]
MTYVVSSEKGRREFETLREAYEFSKESALSRIYEIDHFGNAQKLSQDDITIKLRQENSLKEKREQEKVEEPQEKKSEVTVKIELEKPKEELVEKNEQLNPLLKYGLILIALIITGAVIYFFILPMLRELLDVFSRV